MHKKSGMDEFTLYGIRCCASSLRDLHDSERICLPDLTLLKEMKLDPPSQYQFKEFPHFSLLAFLPAPVSLIITKCVEQTLNYII